MRRILWWLRRDLRLADNATLHHALRDGASVIPVFVLDPKLIQSKNIAATRKQFLYEALRELDANLRTRGSYLVVRRGDAAREVVRLARETEADAVYFHADYTPYARKRDARVCAALDKAGVQYASFHDLYLADPEQVMKKDGSAYTVFTPYRRRFEAVVAIPTRYATSKKLNTPPQIETIAVQDLTATGKENFLCGGERAGRKLAEDFIARKNGLATYAAMRNDLAADATSHLSAHLHFGTVSVRELVRMARDLTPAKVWIDELVWREFFCQVLWHFPLAARQAFRPQYAELEWENDAELFAAWCEGRTGYPIVDAGMRQLNALGWMHNRARMITASFLTKDLLVDWRWGERYFLQLLTDGDVASNNGGWQWAAGTGTDAQPYFRIFSPMRQGARFDAEGAYVRRWVPELERVPNRFIHAPWEMPAAAAGAIELRLGKEYPMPIVDHAGQRERALVLYRSRR